MPTIDQKTLTTIILVVASFMVLGLIAVREYRYQMGKKRKARPPVVAQNNETQYSMFTHLPNAADDLEYDPVGEAQIYLAYGNKSMALSVLNKAAKEHPERDDIRAKINEISESQ